MPVKMTVQALARMLELALVAPSRAPVPLLTLDFSPEGIRAYGMSDDRSTMVAVMLPTDYAEEYEPIGAASIDARDLAAVLRDHFRSESAISISIEEDSSTGARILKVEGVDARYTVPTIASAEDLTSYISQLKVTEKGAAFVEGNSSIAYAYTVEPQQLRSVKKKWGDLKMIATGEALSYQVPVGAGTVTRVLSRSIVEKRHSEPLVFGVEPEILQAIGKSVPTSVVLTVMKDKSDLPALIVFHARAYSGSQYYVYLPTLEEADV